MTQNSAYSSRNITKGRLQTLWVVARQVMQAYPDIFSDKPEFRNWLESRYGLRSTGALTIGQADDAISAMKLILSNGLPYISYGQKQKIKALAGLLGWNRKRLWGFIRRQLQQNKSEDMLLKEEATNIIIGLQRIIARGDEDLFKLLNSKPARWLFSSEGRHKVYALQSAQSGKSN